MVESSRESQEGIIKGWLSGKTREEIANENFVSTGTVSNTIKGWRIRVGNLASDEVREFAITFRRAGMSPLQCARGFRISNLLNDLGSFDDNFEVFLLRMFRGCNNIGLQPDKIAFHIKELVDLTEKLPLDQISEYITNNKKKVEESEQDLKNAKIQLEDVQTKLDNAFLRYNSDISELRWTYWLKRELADRGLEFKSIAAMVDVVEDLRTLGCDAKKIISKICKIDDLESRKNNLKSEISQLQMEKEKERKWLETLKRMSCTHRQAISVYESLASMGLGLAELTTLCDTITELAYENGLSVSQAVGKFIDDVAEDYKLVSGFESKIEKLKIEKEDTEFGLAMLQQSASQLENQINSKMLPIETCRT